MIKNFIVTTIRNIIKDKYYSLINIFGLSVGLTCTILILLYVNHELSYDKYHNKYKKIYRLESHFTISGKEEKAAATSAALGPTLKDEYPEIAEYTRAAPTGKQYLKYNDKTFEEDSIVMADSAFFRIFTHPFIAGDPEKALTRPNTMVITQHMANKYFGKNNPIGNIITDIEGNSYEITGVIENLPSNLHLRFNGLISTETLVEQIGRDQANSRASAAFWSVQLYTYVLETENSSIYNVVNNFDFFYEKYMKEVGDQLQGANFRLMVKPLADVHHHSTDLIWDLPGGNFKYVYIFSIIALFLLIIASINYMNMATARSAKRAKEVAMRKVAGSSRTALMWQFLTES
ncbi:MAG: ABC transporter permease, partial [Bacteroidota bacterium]